MTIIVSYGSSSSETESLGLLQLLRDPLCSTYGVILSRISRAAAGGAYCVHHLLKKKATTGVSCCERCVQNCKCYIDLTGQAQTGALLRLSVSRAAFVAVPHTLYISASTTDVVMYVKDQSATAVDHAVFCSLLVVGSGVSPRFSLRPVNQGCWHTCSLLSSFSFSLTGGRSTLAPHKTRGKCPGDACPGRTTQQFGQSCERLHH